MNEAPKSPSGAKAQLRDARLRREAAALRANLRKRKDQAREWAERPEPPGAKCERPHSSGTDEK